MKSIYTLFAFCLLLSMQATAQDGRYLSEVFTEVAVDAGVVYGTNVTVLTVSDPNIGKPVPRPLVLDIYTPVGDDETERPLVLYFPTGNFLPNPINGGTTGTMKDSSVVEIATRLAKHGYVCAVVDYRKGWNPVSDDPLVRRSTLINAAYRGIQDSRMAVRFFKKTIAEDGNPYGVRGDRIAMWGQGTGGYIVLGSNSIDSYNELLLPKFFGADINGDGNPDPMVIEAFNSNPDGTTNTTNPQNGEPLNIANHAEYSSEFQLAINMGGAMGDLSWVDAEDNPVIAFHAPRDPFAPYGTSELIVPTTGEFVVEVSGSYDVLARSNELGVNQIFKDANFTDVFSTTASARNDGLEGLYPLPRPTGTNPLTGQPALEASPWEWWEPAVWTQVPHPSCPASLPVEQCNFHVIGSISNNDMSPVKGRTYIDTIMGYTMPRAFLALGLGVVAVEEVQDAAEFGLKVTPNPAITGVMIESNNENRMQDIQLFDLSGRMVENLTDLDQNQVRLKRNSLPTGVYIAKIRFAEGIVTQKVIFE